MMIKEKNFQKFLQNHLYQIFCNKILFDDCKNNNKIEGYNIYENILI